VKQGDTVRLRGPTKGKASRPETAVVRKERSRLWINRHRSSNVKHQRARATVSRVKDELSVRALRCMR